MSEQRLPEPHADNVSDDQRGDTQAQHKLQRLDGLPAKLPPLIERPYPKTGVDKRRSVKCDCNREKLPEHNVVLETGSQRIDRDVAERVVEEMAKQISEQYNAAGQPYLPDTNAADQLCDPLLGKSGHAIQSNIHRQQIEDCRVLFPD